MIATQVQNRHPVSLAAVMSDAPSDSGAAARAWTALPSELIDGSEIIMLAVKPSMWRPLFDSAAWLVVTVGLAAALLILGKSIAGLPTVLSAQLVIAIGAARLTIAIIRWVPTWYVLTNLRVLTIQGVRSPRIMSCALVDVRNTYLNASPAEKVMALGTITFVIDLPDRAPQAWQSLTNSQEIHDKIRRAIENALDQHGV